MLQQAGLEEIGIVQAQIFSLVHALQNHGDGAGDARNIVRHGFVEGGGKVVRTAAAIDLLDGKDVAVLFLDHAHDAQRGGTALGIAHQDDLVALRLAANFFQVRLHGQSHIHYGTCRALHMHVRMDAVSGNAKADIVRHHHGIAFGGHQAFHGKALRRAFVVGADGVVAHNHHIFDFSVPRDEQFAGKGDRAAVYVVAGIGAAHVDDVVAVDGSQQVRRQARHAGDSHLGFRVLPFHELHFRIDGTVLQGHLRRFDGANLKGFKIYKFHLGLDASGTQEGRRKEYIALFHRLTMHN